MEVVQQENPASSDVREEQKRFIHMLGMKQVDFGPGFSVFEVELDSVHMNRVGIPHGGVYAAMLDTAMGVSGMHVGNDKQYAAAVTLNCSINFISSPRGKKLIATGTKVGGGKSIYFAQAQVEDETGHLVATATGSFKYLKNIAPS